MPSDDGRHEVGVGDVHPGRESPPDGGPCGSRDGAGRFDASGDRLRRGLHGDLCGEHGRVADGDPGGRLGARRLVRRVYGHGADVRSDDERGEDGDGVLRPRQSGPGPRRHRRQVGGRGSDPLLHGLGHRRRRRRADLQRLEPPAGIDLRPGHEELLLDPDLRPGGHLRRRPLHGRRRQGHRLGDDHDHRDRQPDATGLLHRDSLPRAGHARLSRAARRPGARGGRRPHVHHRRRSATSRRRPRRCP